MKQRPGARVLHCVAKKGGRSDRLQIGEHEVSITNLDKVLYPANGFTKAQVIDYYIRVSPYLLPHFHDRPVTMQRFPDGVGGQAFYEKKAPAFAPEWVKTFPVPRKAGGEIRYILINDLETLVWCANLASIELHPFLHTVPKIDQPTSVVFDLDPGPGTDVLTCAEIALLLRDLLDGLNLKSFAKVSGSKGLQIYVPLNTQATYAVTQPFARAIADLLTKEHPHRILSDMAKSQRADKVFIDWSQNSDFKTTAGVYSLRAKQDKPFASLPVAWEELESAMQSRKAGMLHFEPEAALMRLSNVGDLFLSVLELRQQLPAITKIQSAKTTVAPLFDSETLPRSAMKFVDPMQCELVTHLPEGEDWQYELKLDGYRALAIKDKGTATLISRNGNSLNTKFVSVAAGLKSVQDGVILDGEVVALDKNGRPEFGRLQHLSKNQLLVYYAFDLLAYRGRDLKGLPLKQRRDLLEQVLKEVGDPIRRSAILDAEPHDLIQAIRAQGLEGVIAKRMNSRYEPGERSGRWVKFKVNQGQELVIGGYKPSGKKHFDNLAVGYYDGDRLIFIAKIKNGFTPSTKDEIFERIRQYETKTCPFDNLPEPKNARRGEALTVEAMKQYRWVKPEIVAQIEFTDWTSSNHLRHSRFIALRDDKNPREVVHEIAAHVT